MNSTRPTPDLPEPTPPDALLADLRRLGARLPAIADSLDERIIDLGFRGAVRRRRFWRLASWGGAAAAAAAIGLAVYLRPPPHAPATRLAQSTLPADFDGNGRVDILDAFGLARAVSSGRPLAAASWDLNRDGRVDQADVDALATLAVRATDGAPTGRVMQ